MIAAFALWLEASALGHAARASPWAYPVANLFHLLGLSLILGPVAIVDIRLLGGFRALPLVPLARVLIPLVVIGLLLQFVSGIVLFAADATALIRAPMFQTKLVLIAIAIANAILFERLWRGREPVPPALRLMAASSIALWLAVAACGRLIAYR